MYFPLQHAMHAGSTEEVSGLWPYSLRCVGQGRWLQGGMEGDVTYLKECVENNYRDSWNFQETNLILFYIIFMTNLVVEMFETLFSLFV